MYKAIFVWGQKSFSLCYSKQVPRKKNHAERKLLRLFFSTSIGKGTIVRELLQSRCRSFFEKNVCIGDILYQKCRMLIEQVRVFRPFAMPALVTPPYSKDAAVNTEKSRHVASFVGGGGCSSKKSLKKWKFQNSWKS